MNIDNIKEKSLKFIKKTYENDLNKKYFGITDNGKILNRDEFINKFFELAEEQYIDDIYQEIGKEVNLLKKEKTDAEINKIADIIIQYMNKNGLHYHIGIFTPEKIKEIAMANNTELDKEEIKLLENFYQEAKIFLKQEKKLKTSIN